MKARCIDFTGDRATVLLTPSWWRRLFGARPVCVDVEWHVSDTTLGYRAVTTKRWLADLPHGSLIRDALDFREVGTERRGVPAKPRLSLVGDEAVMP
jgi:hypothetical protein